MQRMRADVNGGRGRVVSRDRSPETEMHTACVARRSRVVCVVRPENGPAIGATAVELRRETREKYNTISLNHVRVRHAVNEERASNARRRSAAPTRHPRAA